MQVGEAGRLQTEYQQLRWGIGGNFGSTLVEMGWRMRPNGEITGPTRGRNRSVGCKIESNELGTREMAPLSQQVYERRDAVREL